METEEAALVKKVRHFEDFDSKVINIEVNIFLN